MIRFLILFLVCLLQVFIYSGNASNLRLRDIDATEREDVVVFRGQPIRQRHRDLIEIERFCNAKLKSDSTTNLVVGKLVIFYGDGREQEISLQQGNKAMVFDSGTHRKDIMDAFKGLPFTFQSSMIDVDIVIAHTARNFPAVRESQKYMNDRRDNMLVAIESKKTVNDAREEFKAKHTELLELIETGSKNYAYSYLIYRGKVFA